MAELTPNTNDQKFLFAILTELRSINERLTLMNQPKPPRKPREVKIKKPAAPRDRPPKPPKKEG